MKAKRQPAVIRMHDHDRIAEVLRRKAAAREAHEEERRRRDLDARIDEIVHRLEVSVDRSLRRQAEIIVDALNHWLADNGKLVAGETSDDEGVDDVKVSQKLAEIPEWLWRRS